MIKSDDSDKSPSSSSCRTEEEYRENKSSKASCWSSFEDDYEKEPEPEPNELKKIWRSLSMSHLAGESIIEGQATQLPCILNLELRNIKVPLPLNDDNKLPRMINNDNDDHNGDYSSIQEFKPNEVLIRNPTWNDKLHEFVRKLAIGLGCRGNNGDDYDGLNVEATLEKVVYLRKGYCSFRHKERTSIDEMKNRRFGTLVVQLPSKLEGGKFRVYDFDGVGFKDIDFGQEEKLSEYFLYFVAYRDELEFEEKEITNGVALRFIYSLCWTTNSMIKFLAIFF